MGQARGHDRARGAPVQRRATSPGAGAARAHRRGGVLRPQPRPGARYRSRAVATAGAGARRPSAGTVPGGVAAPVRRARPRRHPAVRGQSPRQPGARARDPRGRSVGPAATATAVWTGVRLADVLDAAGAGEEAAHVAFEAPDVSQLASPPQRFGASIPTSKARSGEVLLAWAMNHQRLPRVHGAPVRVVVPGYIGARSVKWVEQVAVQDHPSDNYFQATSYRLLPPEADPASAGHGDGLSLGPIALNSDVLAPDDGAHLPAGPTTVSGYALAGGDRGIARVDVSLDEGRTWQQADLDEQASPWSWRFWRTTVELPPGREVTITARRGTPRPPCSPKAQRSCGTRRDMPTTPGRTCRSPPPRRTVLAPVRDAANLTHRHRRRRRGARWASWTRKCAAARLCTARAAQLLRPARRLLVQHVRVAMSQERDRRSLRGAHRPAASRCRTGDRLVSRQHQHAVQRGCQSPSTTVATAK